MATDGILAIHNGKMTDNLDANNHAILNLLGDSAVNVKHYGAVGDGVANDAPAIKLAFDALDAIEGKKGIYFPAGTYLISTSLGTPSYPDYPYGGRESAFNIGSGQITIWGDGPGETVITTPNVVTLFDAYAGNSGGLNLTIRDMSMICTSGYSLGNGNSVAVMANSAHVNSYVIKNVEFSDWQNSIQSGDWTRPTLLGEVTNCYFHYTHGKASTAHLDLGFPSVGITEAATTMIVRNNTWNGADSLTYTGLPGSPPSSMRTAMDGLILTNASGTNVLIEGNTILNHSVEGIYTSYDGNINGNANFSTIIRDNRIVAEPRTADNTSYAPSIRSDRINGLVIEGNILRGSRNGVGLVGNGHNYDIGVQTGKFTIRNNSMLDVLEGVTSSYIASGGTIENNTIRLINNPGTIWTADGSAANRTGVFLDSNTANVEIQDNNISGGDQGWWSASTTVTSGSGLGVLHVASSTGFSVGGLAALKPIVKDGTYRTGVISAVGTGTVTIDAGWEASVGIVANAQVGDTVVFTLGGLSYSGGIIQQGSTGTVIRNNKISDIEMGISVISGTTTEVSGNFVAPNVLQEVANTVNRKVSGIPLTANLITSNATGGISDSGRAVATVPNLTATDNVWTNAAYIVNQFYDTGAGANLKKLNMGWDNGVWNLVMLNDDNTVKISPFSADSIGINATDIHTSGFYFSTSTLPSNSGSNDGRLHFNGTSFYYSSAGTWKQITTGAGGGDASTSNPLSQFAATTSAQLAGVITDETGTGLLVFGTNPILVTPNLGTPAVLTLTNALGLPEVGISTTDVTTNDVSITKHGFAPKLPNDATKYLNGAGIYTVPTASSGDVASDTATSVDAEIALFKATTGKLIKRAVGFTGIAKVTNGVLSVVTAPAGALIGDSDVQTITNKNINSCNINLGVSNSGGFYYGTSGAGYVQLQYTGSLSGTKSLYFPDMSSVGSSTTLVGIDATQTLTNKTLGTGGTQITNIISGTATIDFASMAAGATDTQTITVAGVVTTGVPSVVLGWSAALEAGIVVKQAWVSATNTVSISVVNTTSGVVDPASLTVRATVTRF